MVLQINRARNDSWLKRCGAILMTAVLIALLMSGLSPAETLNQRTFASPAEAVKAMVEALKADDSRLWLPYLGPGVKISFLPETRSQTRLGPRDLSTPMSRKTGW